MKSETLTKIEQYAQVVIAAGCDQEFTAFSALVGERDIKAWQVRDKLASLLLPMDDYLFGRDDAPENMQYVAMSIFEKLILFEKEE